MQHIWLDVGSNHHTYAVMLVQETPHDVLCNRDVAVLKRSGLILLDKMLR